MTDELRASRLDAFKDFERRHALFGTRVQGWSPWRVMRNLVFRHVQDLPLSSARRPFTARVFDALLATPKLIWLLAFGSHRDVFIQSYRSALRGRSNDGFYDINFDCMLMRKISCLKAEVIDSVGFNENAKRAIYPADLNATVFTFWGGVLSSIFAVQDQGFSDRVSRLLYEEFQIELSEKVLRNCISTVRWQAVIYRILLKRIQPKSVLVADTGTYGLRLAAEQCEIPFIELQHGLFDAAHPDAVPADIQGSRGELFLPDIMAVRGDFWAKELAATRQGAGVIGAVGNEQIDRAIVRRADWNPDGKLRLVLTSQGCDVKNLAGWIEGFIASAPGNLSWQIVVKLHPIYDASTTEYERLRAVENIRILSGSEDPNIFDLLVEADAHLSISSAAHYDAAALGVKTFVIPLESSELVEHSVDGSAIVMLSRPSELWMHLLGADVRQERNTFFSKPGYVDNLIALIQTAQIESNGQTHRQFRQPVEH